MAIKSDEWTKFWNNKSSYQRATYLRQLKKLKENGSRSDSTGSFDAIDWHELLGAEFCNKLIEEAYEEVARIAMVKEGAKNVRQEITTGV